ncbi:MAG TPA: DUF4870 domain-containing protein [Phycisphaerales bacterium]|nr:DUF4870 domain-containing protein [Phycisphaerales bacterium]
MGGVTLYGGRRVNAAVPNNPGQAESHVVDPATGEVQAVGLSDAHRVYAGWCHWGPLIAWISVAASSGIAFIVPPLVALTLWQIKKAESPFIDDQGREALNFQISLILLGLILIPVTLLTCGIGAILYIGIPILAIVGGIIGGVRASKGIYFRYPMCFRLV